MALIKCRKCNSDVSDKADICSICGTPVNDLPEDRSDKEGMAEVEQTRIKDIPRKRCVECGKELDADNELCSYCGAPQTVETDVPKVAQQRGNRQIIIISILFILGVVGIGSFFLIRELTQQKDSKHLVADSKQATDSLATAESTNMRPFSNSDSQTKSKSNGDDIKIADVVAVASHTLADQARNSYQASNLLDNSPKTTWATHFTGEEETLMFFIKADRLYKLAISNGYNKNADSFNNNSRAKDIRVYVNDALASEKVLSGDRNHQMEDVILDREYNDVTEVKIVILSVYEGDKWNDLCISDINFYAKQQ